MLANLICVDKKRANATEILHSVDSFHFVLKLVLNLHVESV